MITTVAIQYDDGGSDCYGCDDYDYDSYDGDDDDSSNITNIKFMITALTTNLHIIIYEDYKSDFQFEINKVFDFLGIDKIDINSEEKHMAGGWQWDNDSIKKLMMKKNSIKSLFKFLIPFESLRKNIRKNIQKINTIVVPSISDEDEQMLKQFYHEDVRKLSGLLGRDLNHWTK